MEPTLDFLCHWANFHCNKWPKIGKIIHPSGHTGHPCPPPPTPTPSPTSLNRNVFLLNFNRSVAKNLGTKRSRFFSTSGPKSTENSCYFKIVVFKKAQNLPMFCYFCKKYCRRYYSKIAQSGYTEYETL